MAFDRDEEYTHQIDLDTYIRLHSGEETEWEKQAKAVLIPTPGYSRSLTEIVAELEAGGVSIPKGLRQLAEREQSPGGYFGHGHPIRFKLND